MACKEDDKSVRDWRIKGGGFSHRFPSLFTGHSVPNFTLSLHLESKSLFYISMYYFSTNKLKKISVISADIHLRSLDKNVPLFYLFVVVDKTLHCVISDHSLQKI